MVGIFVLGLFGSLNTLKTGMQLGKFQNFKLIKIVGAAHHKTFRDMEEEFGSTAPEFLLQRCFEMCTLTADPSAPPVRSLFCRPTSQQNAVKRTMLSRPTVPGDYLQNVQKMSLGFLTPGRVWHEKYLCRQFRYLRKTLGHLSPVYCLTFDRTGQLVS